MMAQFHLAASVSGSLLSHYHGLFRHLKRVLTSPVTPVFQVNVCCEKMRHFGFFTCLITLSTFNSFSSHEASTEEQWQASLPLTRINPYNLSLISLIEAQNEKTLKSVINPVFAVCYVRLHLWTSFFLLCCFKLLSEILF